MGKVKVREIPLAVEKYAVKCPYAMAPEAITVHNTANDASAENEIRYMQSNNNEVSFHIAVDDKEAVCGIPLNRNAWHAGDGGNGRGNRKTIAIEICYSKSGGARFIQAEKNASRLIAEMLHERGWGVDRVTKHQDYSGKYCPHRTLDMGWERFLAMVRAELASLGGSASAGSSAGGHASAEFPYVVKITADSLNYRCGAGVGFAVVGQVKRGERYTIVDEENGWGLLKSFAVGRNGWINLTYTERV